MTGRACQIVRLTWPCFAALDRSRLLRPDTSPPWNNPPALPRSFSTTAGSDFDLTAATRKGSRRKRGWMSSGNDAARRNAAEHELLRLERKRRSTRDGTCDTL